MARGKKQASLKYPALHELIQDLHPGTLASAWFNDNGDNEKPIHEYQTHVMGSFRCTSRGCSGRRWTSGHVAILIRGFHGDGYDAVVFNQRCQKCRSLGILTLDEGSYVERVAYRLKKWAGIELEVPIYSGNKVTKPHQSALCEGCKQGYCHGQG